MSDKPANILALGVQDKPGGEVRVTEVLCFNFPPLSKEEIGELSWRVTQFFENRAMKQTKRLP